MKIGDLKAVLLITFQYQLNYELIAYPPSSHEMQHQSPRPEDSRWEQRTDFPKKSMCPEHDRLTPFALKETMSLVQPVTTYSRFIMSKNEYGL